jgi:excisionase family DNA binding protein
MLLTVSEIASKLGYSKSYVLKAIARGELNTLPRTKHRGKYFVDEAEFSRYQEGLAKVDETGKDLAYLVLNRYISQLPDLFEPDNIDQFLSNMASEFNSISVALAPLKQPYQYWSAMLNKMSSAILTTQRAEVLQVIRGTDPMRLLPLLQRDLRQHVRKLRNDVVSEDDPTITRDLLSFCDRMEEWRHFCAIWTDLKNAAVKCFTQPDSDNKYDELKHPSLVVVEDPSLNLTLTWNAFGLVAKPIVVSSIAKWLAEVTTLLGWTFDTVCSLSAAALQLTSFMAEQLGKNVAALDNKTFEFQPSEPLGTCYVVVDTACQTGYHLKKAREVIKNQGKTFVGAIFIAINDMMPNEKQGDRLKLVDDMKKEGTLIYCHDLSYLFHSLPLHVKMGPPFANKS